MLVSILLPVVQGHTDHEKKCFSSFLYSEGITTCMVRQSTICINK